MIKSSNISLGSFNENSLLLKLNAHRFVDELSFIFVLTASTVFDVITIPSILSNEFWIKFSIELYMFIVLVALGIILSFHSIDFSKRDYLRNSKGVFTIGTLIILISTTAFLNRLSFNYPQLGLLSIFYSLASITEVFNLLLYFNGK